jgi:hypothetical protein
VTSSNQLKRAETLAKANIVLEEIFGQFAGKPVTMNQNLPVPMVQWNDPVLQEMQETAEKYGLILNLIVPSQMDDGHYTKHRVNNHVGKDPEGVWRIGGDFTLG